MKLVASAIVRNEADRYLEVWLRHLLTFCDGVVLLDDSSTDATRELALLHPEVAISENGRPSFFEHESVARNRLLEWTVLTAQPEYVLSIDADEFIGDGVALREQLQSGQDIYSLWMREVWKTRRDEVGLRVDGQWGDRRCPILWRAPRHITGSWRIPNRRLACGREPQRVRGRRGHDTEIGIYHFGWTRVAERQARAERYFEHDRGRFHADRHLQSILWPDERVQLVWTPWPPSVPDSVAELAARP